MAIDDTKHQHQKIREAFVSRPTPFLTTRQPASFRYFLGMARQLAKQRHPNGLRIENVAAPCQRCKISRWMDSNCMMALACAASTVDATDVIQKMLSKNRWITTLLIQHAIYVGTRIHYYIMHTPSVN
jgi:hypothetical protein